MNSPTFLSKQTPAQALSWQKKQPMPCTFIFSGESIMPLNLMTLFLTLISKLSHGFSDFLKVPPRCLVSGHYELEKESSYPRPMFPSYRNQSIDFHCKLINRFTYDRKIALK